MDTDELRESNYDLRHAVTNLVVHVSHHKIKRTMSNKELRRNKINCLCIFLIECVEYSIL